MGLASPLGIAAGVLGPVWMCRVLRRHSHNARPLSQAERAAMQGWFEPALLDAVRLAPMHPDPQQQSPPMLAAQLCAWLRRLLPEGCFLHTPTGLTLGDLVLIDSTLFPLKETPTWLIFHELVHVAQYRAMGTRRFFQQYSAGWARAGFVYRQIPLEQYAYAWQDLFQATGMRWAPIPLTPTTPVRPCNMPERTTNIP